MDIGSVEVIYTFSYIQIIINEQSYLVTMQIFALLLEPVQDQSNFISKYFYSIICGCRTCGHRGPTLSSPTHKHKAVPTFNYVIFYNANVILQFSGPGYFFHVIYQFTPKYFRSCVLFESVFQIFTLISILITNIILSYKATRLFRSSQLLSADPLTTSSRQTITSSVNKYSFASFLVPMLHVSYVFQLKSPSSLLISANGDSSLLHNILKSKGKALLMSPPI